MELGDRVLVLGKPAHVLMNIPVPQSIKEDSVQRKELKNRIVMAIESNEPSAR